MGPAEGDDHRVELRIMNVDRLSLRSRKTQHGGISSPAAPVTSSLRAKQAISIVGG